MKKDRKTTYLRLAFVFVAVIVLTVLLELVAAALSPRAARTEDLPIAGTDALKVINLTDVYDNAYRVDAYNHTGGEFLIPGEQLANEEGSAVASRGTYVFLIRGLKENEAPAEELKSIQKGDKLYHLSFYLPAFHGAAVVYLDGTPVLHFGEIEGYDYAALGINGSFTGKHRASSSPAYIDIALNPEERASDESPLAGARVITIHYEAKRDYHPAITAESALIGNEHAVKGVVENNKLALLAFSAFSLFTLACALFATFVRSFRFFFPLAVMSVGFFGVGFMSFLLRNPTSLVYLYEAIMHLSYITILIGASFCFRRKIGRLPLRSTLVIPLCFVGVFFFARPFMNGALNSIAEPLLNAYFIVALLSFGVFIALSVYKGEHFSRMFAPALTVFVISFRFVRFSAYAALLSPAFWLCCALMIYVAYHVITQFIAIERRNKYLARNLQAEVDRQTAEMQRIVVERENALRFLSHDLRKPTRTMHLLLSTLIARESDPEQIKTMKIVEQKLGAIEADLSNLSRALKESHVSEASETVALNELLTEICTSLAPDCIANGIRLHYTPANVNAFVKQQALKSVITNLIINAIEHASCDMITLTLAKKNGQCIITVADNGVGIEKTAREADPFGMYESGQENDGTHGLGLYICRTYLESMQGTLEYEYTEGELIFTITLPLA